MRQPERLTNAQYMVPPSAAYRIFKHHVSSTIPLHWHEFYELEFVVSGRGTHVVNGREVPMASGTMYLLTPADFHEIRMAEGEMLTIYNVIFTAEMLKPELVQLLFSRRIQYMTECAGVQYERMRSEYERIWEEFMHPRAGSRIVAEGAIERMLIDLYRACEVPEPHGLTEHNPHSIEEVIRNAMIYIQHRFRDSLTLEQAAASCGLSANYFSECFHRVVGMPFQTYLADTRLEFAKALLGVSQLSVTEVCYASGFNTLAHFERMFKRKYGHTPSRYRRECAAQSHRQALPIH